MKKTPFEIVKDVPLVPTVMRTISIIPTNIPVRVLYRSFRNMTAINAVAEAMNISAAPADTVTSSIYNSPVIDTNPNPTK